MYHLYIAFWRVICYLPPIEGTRNNHWSKRWLALGFLNHLPSIKLTRQVSFYSWKGSGKWRYEKKKTYLRLFWDWVFPYISPENYSLYGWGLLHFRYMKCLVIILITSERPLKGNYSPSVLLNPYLCTFATGCFKSPMYLFHGLHQGNKSFSHLFPFQSSKMASLETRLTHL